MKITSTYSVKIKDRNRSFKNSVFLYRKAVDWYIDICLSKWDEIKLIDQSKARMNYVQAISTVTASHPYPEYDFTTEFYKFPVYLRRAAIMEALGLVSSYKSNYANWEEKKEGKEPGIPKAGYVYPVLYSGNMFIQSDTYEAKIKVWIRNTWDWVTVKLKKSDVDYILHHCRNGKVCSPTLQKRGKEWFLDFPIEYRSDLTKKKAKDQTVLAVDLGINSACTCSLMRSDGTVIGRSFLKLPIENDSLNHKLNKIKQAQQRGNRKMPRLWASVNGMNDHIAVETANFIIAIAEVNNADVIVFEHLDTKGKKKGSKKQRLHFWKANYVQDMVEHKAHKLGMRIARVCAWNTSKLAYDGSGEVERNINGSYSVCKFKTGKIYNCDLNASYNIGARYFIRELLKSCSETDRLRILANIPECSRRITCTLSSLIKLSAEL